MLFSLPLGLEAYEISEQDLNATREHKISFLPSPWEKNLYTQKNKDEGGGRGDRDGEHM